MWSIRKNFYETVGNSNGPGLIPHFEASFKHFRQHDIILGFGKS